MAKKNITVLNWVLEEKNFTRLCETKSILTMNGMFPGPTLYAYKGQRIKVNVVNQGSYNVTIHWHGVKQPRNPWSDGPEYVTQCPIKPGANFTYEIILSTEEGTLWWHAHSDWTRATVHGAIVVYPKNGTNYPFTKPDGEFPIVLASWFKGDIPAIVDDALRDGTEFNISDAFTFNGQPGDRYNCSKDADDMFNITFDYGKTYLLRVINAIMNEEMFFMVANHTFTLVGTDGAYTKPLVTDYVLISPGQTMDLLITANQTPSYYYMAARPIEGVVYNNSTTSAFVKYSGNYTVPSSPSFPDLPYYNDTDAADTFVDGIRSLASEEHPVDVPQTVDTQMYIVISMNSNPCAVGNCSTRLASSMNNISFRAPTTDILQAYYKEIEGIYTTDFPDTPSLYYNFTGDNFTENIVTSTLGARVKVLEYNTTVELVIQGTNVLSGAENHPTHLHGFSFYFVGSGYGNFDNETGPQSYNLVDPPEVNTVGVPKNGWAAVRFRADNPGVWFMHCHLERHASWGMDMVFIVKNGPTRETSMRRAPHQLNPC
ncbi:Laccase [Bertholletia excelsa]